MMAVEVFAAAFMLVAGAADRPVLPPRGDVAVTYRTTGAAASLIPQGMPQGISQGISRGGPAAGPADAPGQMRLRWSSAGKLRLEAEGRPQVLLLDTSGPSAFIVDSTLRSAISVPMKQRDLDAILLTNADITRERQDRVAGLDCTVWSVHARNREGTVCITADGVPLRVEGTVDGRQGTLTATSVDASPQPAALFQIPSGYMSFSLPKFGK